MNAIYLVVLAVVGCTGWAPLGEEEEAQVPARIGRLPAADTGVINMAPASPNGASTLQFDMMVCGAEEYEILQLGRAKCPKYRVFVQAGANWRLVVDQPQALLRFAADHSVPRPTKVPADGQIVELSASYKAIASTLVTQATSGFAGCNVTIVDDPGEAHTRTSRFEDRTQRELWATPFDSEWHRIACPAIVPDQGMDGADLSAFFLQLEPSGPGYGEVWSRAVFKYRNDLIDIRFSTMKVDDPLPATVAGPSYEEYPGVWMTPPIWSLEPEFHKRYQDAMNANP